MFYYEFKNIQLKAVLMIDESDPTDIYLDITIPTSEVDLQEFPAFYVFSFLTATKESTHITARTKAEYKSNILPKAHKIPIEKVEMSALAKKVICENHIKECNECGKIIRDSNG